MKTTSISFIGGGNMARSLIAGLLQNGWSASAIHISEPNADNAALLLQLDPTLNICSDSAAAVAAADVVMFAVKPQIMQTVVSELQPALQSRQPMLISIAAGITLGSLDNWSGGELALVRCMPNTPAMVSSGATGLCANGKASAEQKALAESLLRAVGITVWLEDEAQLDTVTALSGSGPAYYFLIMEAMQAAAETLGLPPKTAQLLSLQTAFGAAKLALESAEDFATLRHNVTSPGGTTEQAINALENAGIRDIFLQAMQAAATRSAELSQQAD